jgi:hypothetical protein
LFRYFFRKEINLKGRERGVLPRKNGRSQGKLQAEEKLNFLLIMIFFKVERRSSGRLVSKRIILSEDDDEGGTNDENAVPSSGNFRRNGKRRSLNFNATTGTIGLIWKLS